MVLLLTPYAEQSSVTGGSFAYGLRVPSAMHSSMSRTSLLYLYMIPRRYLSADIASGPSTHFSILPCLPPFRYRLQSRNDLLNTIETHENCIGTIINTVPGECYCLALVKGEVNVKSVTIKNGMLLSPVNGLMGERGDVILRDGRIAKVGEGLPEEGEVIDASSLYVTPGFIDIHTHVYPKSFLGLEPDVLGLERGATTVLDAGSSGCKIRTMTSRETISIRPRRKSSPFSTSLRREFFEGHELNDPSKIDVEACERVAREHADNIVGIKARASSSVVGEEGLRPIVVAARTAHELATSALRPCGQLPTCPL